MGMHGENGLEQSALEVRREVLSMCHVSGASHIGGCLSCVELLVALYFGKVARVDPKNPQAQDRDFIILSKGHASAALYATLGLAGFFDRSRLQEFYKNGSELGGHPTRGSLPGIEASTGSLGHGLGLGCGMALAAAKSGAPNRAFVILGDGELDEGSVWEAILFAGASKLGNLFALVDYNKIQSFGSVDEVLPLEPLEDKFRSFGWDVKRVDGNSMQQVLAALSGWESPRPKALIADTVKGKGVSYMEGRLEWHYKSPSDKEYKQAMSELV